MSGSHWACGLGLDMYISLASLLDELLKREKRKKHHRDRGRR